MRPDQAAAIDAAFARGDDPGPMAGVPVTIKVNIDNVNDTVYYSSLYQAWPTLGAGRSVRITLTSKF